MINKKTLLNEKINYLEILIFMYEIVVVTNDA